MASCFSVTYKREWYGLRMSVCFETVHRHASLESDLQSELESLRSELSHANNLVASLQRKGGDVLPLSAEAAKAAALFKSGMSTTQLYSKYIEVTLR